MYRTNHFNSSNFPICDLSNAQTYVCNVGAGTDTDVVKANTKALLSAYNNMIKGGN